MNEAFIMGTVKGYFLGKLDDWDVEDIEGLLSEPLPLADLLDGLTTYICGFRNIILKHQERLIQELNIQTIIRLTRENLQIVTGKRIMV